MYKNSRDLFPNFWSFYGNFEKKGYVKSNVDFQTRYKEGSKNIFDMVGNEEEGVDYGSI